MSDWQIVRLGDLLEAKYGKALPQALRQSGDVPVYGSNGIVGWHNTPITSGPTIVVGRKGSFGAVNFSKVPCWPIDTTYFVDDPGPYQMEFLYHLLGSLGLTELDQSTAIPGLSRDQLYDIKVPVPTLEEQSKISQLISAAKERQASSIDHLGVARRAIERCRQAVIVAACSGRLTADWREAHLESASAKALLDDIDSLSRSRHRPPPAEWEFEIPGLWALVSLDRLTTLITSGSRGWGKYYAPDGPLFIRAQNINSDRLDLTDIAHVRPPNGSEGERTKVRDGDLLVTITGANVTKSAFVARHIGEAYVNQHVALGRPILPALTEYLHLWIVSPEHGRKKLAADAYGAGKPGLNLDNLRAMPVGLPSLEEQAEIVSRVKVLLALTDRVHEKVVAATHRVDRSSQAVLANAFRGELVPPQAERARDDDRGAEPLDKPARA
jgi:type I restriction enzyme S subunit